MRQTQLLLCNWRKWQRSQKCPWPFVSESSGSSANKPHDAKTSLSSLRNLLSLFTFNPFTSISVVLKEQLHDRDAQWNEMCFSISSQSFLKRGTGGLGRRARMLWKTVDSVKFSFNEGLFKKRGKWWVKDSVPVFCYEFTLKCVGNNFHLVFFHTKLAATHFVLHSWGSGEDSVRMTSVLWCPIATKR